MPSSSKKQHNFMAAIANNPSFAKKAGVPQSVGKDFIVADKGKKIPGSGARPDLQRVNSPKTNQGKNELFKKGGDIMAKSDMKEDTKMDKSQDKAMIKKAFKQHDSQEHKGGKGTSLKLARGGMGTKKMADGGMGGGESPSGMGGQGGGDGGGMRGGMGMGRNAIQAAKQAIRATNQQNRAAVIAARQAAKAAPAAPSSGPVGGYGRGDGGGASSGGGGGDGGGAGGGMKRGGSVKKMAGGGYTVPSNGIMDKGGAGMKRGGSVKRYAEGGDVEDDQEDDTSALTAYTPPKSMPKRPVSKTPTSGSTAKRPSSNYSNEGRYKTPSESTDETKMSVSDRLKASRAKSRAGTTDTRSVSDRIRSALGFAKGGSVGSFRSAANGVAQRGKTRGKMI